VYHNNGSIIPPLAYEMLMIQHNANIEAPSHRICKPDRVYTLFGFEKVSPAYYVELLSKSVSPKQD
jgi:hypothetical protein